MDDDGPPSGSLIWVIDVLKPITDFFSHILFRGDWELPSVEP
ncbi:hypothetical protein HMPREF0294_0317 [Corynebacterium glucuronolyticum ATCC 51867]|nr:hypothetical protein HMPREF0294_0317 [Corynebacterium glucuronolyticum ATCC 51867]